MVGSHIAQRVHAERTNEAVQNGTSRSSARQRQNHSYPRSRIHWHDWEDKRAQVCVNASLKRTGSWWSQGQVSRQALLTFARDTKRVTCKAVPEKALVVANERIDLLESQARSGFMVGVHGPGCNGEVQLTDVKTPIPVERGSLESERASDCHAGRWLIELLARSRAAKVQRSHLPGAKRIAELGQGMCPMAPLGAARSGREAPEAGPQHGLREFAHSR